MAKKIAGVFACIAFLCISIFMSAKLDKMPYTHQYKAGEQIPEYEIKDIFALDGYIRQVGEYDYCLDDFFFANVAGEVMNLAPSVEYLKSGYSFFLHVQDPLECIKNYEYIVEIIPKDDSVNKELPEQIVSFVDYNYFSTNGRYMYALDQGIYSLKEIKKEISFFEKCLYSYEYEDEDYGHQNQVNEANFANFFILYELAYPGYYEEENFVFYKDEYGRYRVLTGNFNNSTVQQYKDDNAYHNLSSSMWFSMMLKSQVFTGTVLDEYDYLRKTCLSNDYLLQMLDECTDLLLRTDDVDIDRVLEEKQAITDYLNKRLAWLDENIYCIKEFSALSAVKEYRNQPY